MGVDISVLILLHALPCPGKDIFLEMSAIFMPVLANLYSHALFYSCDVKFMLVTINNNEEYSTVLVN